MEKSRDVILVTGATGQQGGAVARHLLGDGFKVRAMTRKPDSEPAKALARKGAQIVQGDLDDPASLKTALQGAWGAFAIQNTWEAGVEKEEEQGKRFATIAKEQGIKHFVYSSVGSAHRKTGIPHFDNKWRVEETVRELEFPSHTILRPVFFMENFASPWFKPGLDEGRLVVGIEPTTVLQMIAVDDVGKYGHLAFAKHEQLKGAALDLAGDQHTMPQVAEILSAASGRKIEFVQADIAEVRKWSEDYALMLEWFDRVGYNADIGGMEKKYGVRPTSFKDWAKQVRW